MNERTARMTDGLFWTAIAWICGLVAGCVFGYVIGGIAGYGGPAGFMLGGAVAIATGWILSTNNGSDLPPPNTVRIAVPPAPTEPREPAPPPSTLAAPEAATRQALAEVGSSAAPVDAGVVEEGEAPPPRIGTRPATLEGPREGGPDDLKEIKGVGPKLEALLHRLGFFHFDQIAGWTEDELAWVDMHLEDFRGRATRDDWVGQSRILAAGGETEHSRRVQDDEN